MANIKPKLYHNLTLDYLLINVWLPVSNLFSYTFSTLDIIGTDSKDNKANTFIFQAVMSRRTAKGLTQALGATGQSQALAPGLVVVECRHNTDSVSRDTRVRDLPENTSPATHK